MMDSIHEPVTRCYYVLTVFERLRECQILTNYFNPKISRIFTESENMKSLVDRRFTSSSSDLCTCAECLRSLQTSSP